MLLNVRLVTCSMTIAAVTAPVAFVSWSESRARSLPGVQFLRKISSDLTDFDCLRTKTNKTCRPGPMTDFDCLRTKTNKTCRPGPIIWEPERQASSPGFLLEAGGGRCDKPQVEFLFQPGDSNLDTVSTIQARHDYHGHRTYDQDQQLRHRHFYLPRQQNNQIERTHSAHPGNGQTDKQTDSSLFRYLDSSTSQTLSSAASS
jgi:hypothetical protein